MKAHASSSLFCVFIGGVNLNRIVNEATIIQYIAEQFERDRLEGEPC